MISLYAFLDETGDVKSDDRIFMCGYASWDSEWNRFSEGWGDALRRAGSGPIHATDLLSGSDAFYGWEESKRDTLVTELIETIRKTIPIGIAIGFDVKTYRSFTPGQQNKLGRPLLVCMSRAIDAAVEIVEEMRAQGDAIAGINLTFDDSEKTAVHMLDTWVKLKRARPDLVNYIKSVGFADDRWFYPLQAADLLANLTNRFWRPALLKEPKSSDLAERHLRALLTSDPSYQFAYRVKVVMAAEQTEAVRMQKRLY